MLLGSLGEFEVLVGIGLNPVQEETKVCQDPGVSKCLGDACARLQELVMPQSIKIPESVFPQCESEEGACLSITGIRSVASLARGRPPGGGVHTLFPTHTGSYRLDDDNGSEAHADPSIPSMPLAPLILLVPLLNG